MKKENITKKQHYIPRFYLERFTDNDGYLYIYDIENNHPFRTVPEKFGYERYLYETRLSKPNRNGEDFLLTNHIEDIFAQYEGKFDMFLKKLDRICTPNQRKNALILKSDEKKLLLSFIANLVFRNPITMDYLHLDEVPADIFEEDAKAKLNEFLSIIDVCNADELLLAAIKKVMLTDESEKNNIKSFIESNSDLHFTFFYSKGLQFITSSYPVILGNDITVVSENKRCIFLALSPNLAVLYDNYDNSKEKNNRLGVVDDEVVEYCNMQQLKPIFNQNKYIIANSKELINRYFATKEG